MLMLNLAMEAMEVMAAVTEDSEVDMEEVMEATEVDMVDTDMVVMDAPLKLPLKLMLVMVVTDMEATEVVMEATEVAMVDTDIMDKLHITSTIIVI